MLFIDRLWRRRRLILGRLRFGGLVFRGRGRFRGCLGRVSLCFSFSFSFSFIFSFSFSFSWVFFVRFRGRWNRSKRILLRGKMFLWRLALWIKISRPRKVLLIHQSQKTHEASVTTFLLFLLQNILALINLEWCPGMSNLSKKVTRTLLSFRYFMQSRTKWRRNS